MPRTKNISVPNRLLAALPRKDYRKLLPFLEPVELAFAEVLYEAHARIRHVYFPSDCFVSMLTSVDSGRVAEVGLVGSEGMIGVPVVLGAAVSPFRAVVQGGGTAMRMSVAPRIARMGDYHLGVIQNHDRCARLPRGSSTVPRQRALRARAY